MGKESRENSALDRIPKIDFTPYPLSVIEVIGGRSSNIILRQQQADTLIPDIMKHGLYPEVYLQKNPQQKQLFLGKIVESYLFKDILSFQKVRNPRREIGKNYKVYFIDLGIRNALIDDFNELAIRSDIGAPWENFLAIERLKYHANKGVSVQSFFWRSYSGAEVDYLEKAQSGNLKAFEFKYGGDSLSRGTKSFSRIYETPVKLVNQDNYFKFIISQFIR